ncbi:MAG: hypothetical protein ACK5C5_10265 [Bacteroidota bacterium]|jgi:hypothetical protein
MKLFNKHILLLLILALFTFLAKGQANEDNFTRLSKQIQLIQESKTADDIYVIKQRIEKFPLDMSSDVNFIRKVRDSYLMMADKLASYDHYKSGCVVYFKYLELEQLLHSVTIKLLQDSLSTTSQSQDESFASEKANAEEIMIQKDTVVEETSEKIPVGNSVASEKQDYTIWIISLSLIALVFAAIGFGQRKSYRRMSAKLQESQSEVKRLFRISATVSMISGVIRYAREFSAHCSGILNEMIEASQSKFEKGKSIPENELESAKEAVMIFDRISSGGKKSDNTTGSGS